MIAACPEIDFETFWHDNATSLRDPFSPENPQTPMAIGMGTFSMFAELGLKQDMRRVEEDPVWALECMRAYNDKAQKIVGRRILHEPAMPDPEVRPPHIPGLGELFGCRRIWQSESWWLLEAADHPKALEQILDRIEALDLQETVFNDAFLADLERYRDCTGKAMRFSMGLRGPVTLATSIYGVENLIFLLLDDTDLADRFRDVLLKTIVRYYSLLEAHMDIVDRTPGFRFYDDNCAMLTPDLYARFAQPILRAVYERFAPGARDLRYQHSDSAMEHLLPLLAETGMNRVNFGPTVRFAQIREAMPHAIVEGTLAPFTFMRNQTDEIIREVQRDLAEARSSQGLVVATAGSVNDGTRLSSLRTVMDVIWVDRAVRTHQVFK